MEVRRVEEDKKQHLDLPHGTADMVKLVDKDLRYQALFMPHTNS